ncbi:MAG: hypothetical protein O8C62_03965 [Candidatus Methanoperedens sp.]|nr:hypothetical protein [Candidatus Methanoperedens sp.]
MMLSVKKLSDIYKLLASLLLIIIGLVSLVLILWFRNQEVILLSIGVTFIASGITTFIFFPMEKDIVNTIHDDVMTTFHLAKDYDTYGIKRVFYRSDDSFKDELQKHFKGNKILMMGTTTVGGFFGKDPPHSNLFEEFLNKGTEFEIILLDPCSDAARDNAVAEQENPVFKEDKFYSISTTFNNLRSATQYFCQNAKKVPENQLKVWYTEELPPMLFIKTDSFTFIEFYVMRDLESLPEGAFLKLQEEGYKAHGGYTPIFLVANDSEFAKFAESHFEGIIKNKRVIPLEEVARKLGIDCQSREKNRKYI